MEDSHANVRRYNLLGLWNGQNDDGFYSPSSETDVSIRCFLTYCCVDMYKYEL